MEINTLLYFLMSSVIITIVPGPDNMYLLALSLGSGVRQGLALVQVTPEQWSLAAARREDLLERLRPLFSYYFGNFRCSSTAAAIPSGSAADKIYRCCLSAIPGLEGFSHHRGAACGRNCQQAAVFQYLPPWCADERFGSQGSAFLSGLSASVCQHE